MALIPGSIPVTGFIGPTDSNDTYAVTDAIYGIDGFRSVSATTARNSITTERRREGMLVYTQADQNVWQLLPGPWSGTDADWKLFISSAATNSLTATTGFLSLSGGTVSGDTSFATNLSANTLFINNTNIGNLFIALSGTNGNPVTGDIEISDDINLSWNAGADLLQYNSTSTNIELTTSNGFDVVSGGILSAGTNLYQIFATTGSTLTGNFLPLSGGTMYGDITMSSSTKLVSYTGGGELQLDAYGTPGEVILSNDNAAWTDQSQVYLSQNYAEFSNYFSAGTTYIAGGYNTGIGQPYGEIEMGQGISGIRIKRLAGNELLEIFNQAVNIQSVQGSIDLNVSNHELLIKDNSTISVTSSTNPKSAVLIGSENSIINSGITNTVVIGGNNLVASNSNSLYTQNARLAENGGVIYSAGTNLYQIFATTGATITGNYLPLSGGTVTGNTVFTTGLTANTLVLTENTNAPLNIPILTSNPGTLTDGDIWVLSAATGNAWLSIRIGGTTKLVELT